MSQWLKVLKKTDNAVSLKEREMQILHLLSEGRSYYEIADALQISYELVKKDVQSIYRELGVHCKKEALRRARKLKLLDGSRDSGQERPWMLRPSVLAVISVVGILLFAGYSAWMSPRPCSEFADLTQRKWEDVSATWENVAGTHVVVREAHTTDYFGKVESETLTVDLRRCPILHISVNHVEPEAGYTIQILDKRSEEAADIVKGDQAGDWAINLAQDVNWQQPEPQTFTINIWVSGEGKAVTLDHLSIGAQ